MMGANERKREADRRYYAKNRLARIESSKAYAKENKEKVEAYRNENREKKRAKDREYHQKNKAKKNESSAEWRNNNKDYVLKQAAVFRENNKEKIQSYYSDYKANNKESFRVYSVKRRLAVIANVPTKDIPDDLLDAKLKLIEVKKFIQNYRKGVVYA